MTRGAFKLVKVEPFSRNFCATSTSPMESNLPTPPRLVDVAGIGSWFSVIRDLVLLLSNQRSHSPLTRPAASKSSTTAKGLIFGSSRRLPTYVVFLARRRHWPLCTPS